MALSNERPRMAKTDLNSPLVNDRDWEKRTLASVYVQSHFLKYFLSKKQEGILQLTDPENSLRRITIQLLYLLSYVSQIQRGTGYSSPF